jgi:hypothetical protein
MSDDEQVLQAIERLGGRERGINELSVLYACPKVVSVYETIRQLVASGVLKRLGLYAVQIVKEGPLNVAHPIEPKPPLVQKADVTENPEREPTPETKLNATHRVRRARSKRLGSDRMRELAARVIDLLAHQCRQREAMPYRTLCRRLSAHRYAEWHAAIDWLTDNGAIRITGGKVEFLDATAKERLELPDTFPAKPRTRPKRRRSRSEWFDALYRRAAETGTPIRALIEQDRAQKAFPSTIWQPMDD